MTYFISDTHFGHNNIIPICERPFSDTKEMDKYMIEKWNSVVTNNDKVYHLGDVSWGNKEYTQRILGSLHGTKYLIKGNHDRGRSNQWFREVGFQEVYDHPIILTDTFFTLSHEPQDFTTPAGVNLFGHVHNSDLYPTQTAHHFCVCVERHDYTPISMEHINELFHVIKNNTQE